MGWLLDTSVLSELRKGRRCDASVSAWFASVDSDDLYTSVLVVGELRRGIELLRRRNRKAAESLDGWLIRVVTAYADRVLPIDARVADAWGGLAVPDPLPIVDGLLAATASVNGHVLVTRNVRDVARSGVAHLNPFQRRPG